MYRELIENLLNQKKTVEEIANETGHSISWVRYWMKKSGLKAVFPSGKKSWTDEQMIEAIRTSYTISDVLRKLGLKIRPGNYDTVNHFIYNNGISVTHMTGQKSGYGGKEQRTLDEILKENSSCSRKTIKRRLIQDGLLKEQCSLCGQETVWKGKKLVLVLDHINGINNDCRLSNLRLLCPNCNSQQITFCNKGKNKVVSHCECGKQMTFGSKKCLECYRKIAGMCTPRKVANRPNKEELEKLLKNNSWTSVGRKFGVCDNTVKKWCRLAGVNIPVRGVGYWTRERLSIKDGN